MTNKLKLSIFSLFLLSALGLTPGVVQAQSISRVAALNCLTRRK